MDQINIFPQHIIIESLLTILKRALKMHYQTNTWKPVETFTGRRLALFSLWLQFRLAHFLNIRTIMYRRQYIVIMLRTSMELFQDIPTRIYIISKNLHFYPLFVCKYLTSLHMQAILQHWQIKRSRLNWGNPM